MVWSLVSIQSTAGYLQSCPVSFSSGLNCIIGARGTCKSTIVETIRFVFDCEPERIKDMVLPAPASLGASSVPRAGLIHETLAGGTARCTLTQPADPLESSYVVERNLQAGSRVFRDGVQQVDGAHILQRMEVYSQGDLQSIAEQPKRRLALIDRQNQSRVEELVAGQRAHAAKLRELGNALRQRRPEIESRETKVRGLDANRRQLSELQANRPVLSPELEAERVAYEGRRRVYERLRTASDTRARALASARTLLSDEDALRDGSVLAGDAPSDLAEELRVAMGVLAEPLATLRLAVESATEMQPLLAKLAAEFERKSARYYELRKEQQEVNDILKTEETLRSTIAALESVANELAALQLEQAQGLARREELRLQRDSAADELYSLRMSQIDAINAQYGQQIILTLQQGALTDSHRRTIEDMLQRSNLRNQSEVARELAERIRPSDLVDMVEAGDAKRLAEILGRDLGQMTRLVSHLIDSSKLYELETVIPEDGLEITMVVRGESRALGQLSKGQMATALLPLILRDADYPLIVDQPEDDLDNAFVFQNLIERVKSLSERRQLIFVTHNANIPVLGDAGRVIVMEMDGPRKALPCRYGTVDEMKDDIIQILEGGKDAFKTRHDRYSTALG